MTLVRTKGNLSRCCLILRVRSPGTERGLGRGALNDGGDRLEACERGGVAQMGEHLPCKQGVRSSILLISTILRKGKSGEGERGRPPKTKWAHSSGG